MKRLFLCNSAKSLVEFVLVAGLLFAYSPIVSAQSAGYDLFQTGSGASIDLSSVGLGNVALSGVPIQSSTGNTDTIIQRTQDVPPGGGSVATNVNALYMKSSSSV